MPLFASLWTKPRLNQAAVRLLCSVSQIRELFLEVAVDDR